MLAAIVLSTELKFAITGIAIGIGGLVLMILYGRQLLSGLWSDMEISHLEARPNRSADEPAPPGTVEYIQALTEAAQDAPAEFILSQACRGATIKECQQDWIAELLEQKHRQQKTVANPKSTVQQKGAKS